MHYPEKLTYFLPITTTLSVSALYEIIEWLVADIFFVEQGISYLGAQGDVWDSQKDMAMAFIGAVIAFILFCLYLNLKSKIPFDNTVL